jgi:hypothetical protein
LIFDGITHQKNILLFTHNIKEFKLETLTTQKLGYKHKHTMIFNALPADLPESFVPGEHHIIIGRGRLVKQHIANRSFDQMIADISVEYSSAPGKAEKGLILTKLINMIHDQSPDSGFVRKDPITGRWSMVEESLARQTAAQALRNYLSNEYRSSKQFKQKRRIQQIKEMAELQRTNSGCSINKMTSIHPMSVASSARCVSPSDHDFEVSQNTLAILFSVFGTNISLCDNPFEPRPMAPSFDFDDLMAFDF